MLALALAMMPVAKAQWNDNTVRDARSGALGGVVLWQPDSCMATLTYRQGYLMAELATRQLWVQQRVGRLGATALGYAYFGSADYSEQQLAVAYGLRVAEGWQVGVAARWLYAGAADAHYEPVHWLAPSALVRMVRGRAAAACWGGLRPWDSARPWRLHVQATYRTRRDVLTLVELESEERWRLRAGMEYMPVPHIALRAGVSTRPLVPAFGVGCRWRCMAADLAAEWHPVLGLTPQISLSLWW